MTGARINKTIPEMIPSITDIPNSPNINTAFRTIFAITLTELIMLLLSAFLLFLSMQEKSVKYLSTDRITIPHADR